MLKPPTRLAIATILLWLVFLATANYATVWTKADFARIADGPLTTFHVSDAGWPLSFIQQRYGRSPSPHITLAVNGARALSNVLLIVFVQISLAFLVWRRNAITLLGLFALTAIAAIVMTSAVSSADRFGGTVLYYAVLYAYMAPVALAGIRLPAQLIKMALWFLRSRGIRTTQPCDESEMANRRFAS